MNTDPDFSGSDPDFWPIRIRTKALYTYLLEFFLDTGYIAMLIGTVIICRVVFSMSRTTLGLIFHIYPSQ